MFSIKKHLWVYKGLPRDIYFLFISAVVNRMGSFIIPLMTLILTEKIGFSKSGAGLFSTISMLSQAPFILLGGKLADRIGSRKTIVIFDILGSFVYLACGFMKPGMAVAFLLVVASNLYAIASPAYNSIVAEIARPALVKNAYSLMYLGINLGFAVGPVLGGLLFNSHLNLLFIIDALTTILSTALIIFFVKDKKKAGAAERQLEGEPADSPGAASVFSFLLRTPALLIFSAALLIYNFCYIQWNFMLSMHTAAVFKANGAGIYSMLFSINAVTVIVFTPLLTSVTQKVHPLKSIFIGGLLYFCSFAMFSVNRFVAVFITAVIIMTFGEILIAINTNSYIAQCTPQTHIGRMNSLLFILNGVGFAAGPVVMGNALTMIGFPEAWLIISALMLCGTLIMYFVRRYDKITIQVDA